jgi:hypothetical protein
VTSKTMGVMGKNISDYGIIEELDAGKSLSV